MTFNELAKQLEARCIVFPNLKEQMIYALKIDPDGVLRISLDSTTVEIPLT